MFLISMLGFGLGLCGGALPAQNPGTYIPNELKREVPAEVRNDLEKIAAEIVAGLGKAKLSNDEKEEFGYRVAIEMRSYHLSSQLFYDGPMYDYVNKVADHLLRNDAATRAKVKVYISRSTTVNALTFPDGSILVNLGLLTRLNSEAELAFVLAHEIAHFQRQHGLQREEMEKAIKVKPKHVEAVFEGNGNPDRLLGLFKFSRENEAEADLLGLALFLESDYAPASALSALEILKTSGLPIHEENVNLFMHFQKGDFNIDTLAIRSFTRSDLEARRADEAKAKPDTKKKPKFDEAELATHPEIEDRIAAIQAQLDKTPKQTGKSQAFVQPEQAFQALRVAAGCESLITWKEGASYAWALYNALKGYESAPENQFFIEQAAQNLFWICVLSYSEQGLGIPKYTVTSNPGYANLLFFIKNRDKASLSSMLRNFLEGYSAEFPESETLLILQGRLATLMGDKATANSKYDLYLSKFPNGNHAPFATYQQQHAQ